MRDDVKRNKSDRCAFGKETKRSGGIELGK